MDGAIELKGDHRTTTAREELHRSLVLWMGLKSGIENLFDSRMGILEDIRIVIADNSRLETACCEVLLGYIGLRVYIGDPV